MLRFTLFLCAFLLSGAACAHEGSRVECPYADQVIHDLDIPVSGQVISEGKGRDKDSGEHLVKREWVLENGDTLYIEQKYCSMYNLTAIYHLAELDESSFERGLGVIHSVVKSVDQDYRLKSPLEDIVNMTMNQRGLTLNESFEYGLPLQAVQSSNNVEHTIVFKLLPDGDELSAKIEFYLGVGGL